MFEKLDEMQGIQQLDLSGLVGWFTKNQAATHAILAEYHDIFSFEPGEFGCTDLAKHEIKVTDDEPFKERFQKERLLW